MKRPYKPSTRPAQVPEYVLDDIFTLRPLLQMTGPDMLAAAWEYWRHSSEVERRVELARQLVLLNAEDPDTLADPIPQPEQREMSAGLPQLSFQEWKAQRVGWKKLDGQHQEVAE